MGKVKIAFLFLASLCILYACQKGEDFKGAEAILSLPAVPYAYDTSINKNNNVPTLGRTLFYDSRLSVNNSISCANCHKQAKAFADNVSFSNGFEGKPTFRNSMPIQNLVGSPFVVFGEANDVFQPTNPNETGNEGMPPTDTLSLFWDGREKLLKAMVLRPITNHVEMGITDLDAMALKLSQIPDYQNLFSKAYGSPEVTQLKIADALSQFLMNIKSNNTSSTFLSAKVFNSRRPRIRVGFYFNKNTTATVVTK